MAATDSFTTEHYEKAHARLSRREWQETQERLADLVRVATRDVRALLTKSTATSFDRRSEDPSRSLSSRVQGSIYGAQELLRDVNNVIVPTDSCDPLSRYGDEEMESIRQTYLRKKSSNDGHRLRHMLAGMSPRAKRMEFTPLELDRLTVAFDDSDRRRRQWNPEELFAKKVLIPKKSLYFYRHLDAIPMRVSTVRKYVEHDVTLRQTGVDDASNSALYDVQEIFRDQAHHLLSLAVTRDQEQMFTTLLDDRLAEMVQGAPTRYRADSLAVPQRGTMKIPLASVKEDGKMYEFPVTWAGLNIRTFDTRLLSPDERKHHLLPLQALDTTLQRAEQGFESSVPDSLCEPIQI